jgi:hypothetical protein
LHVVGKIDTITVMVTAMDAVMEAKMARRRHSSGRRRKRRSKRTHRIMIRTSGRARGGRRRRFAPKHRKRRSNQIPRAVLEKRYRRLGAIIRARGGSV